MTGVAITRMRPPGCAAAAGLTAGSMPIRGRNGYFCRSGPMAAPVAVLQAITTAFAPRAISRPTCTSLSARTSASLREP